MKKQIKIILLLLLLSNIKTQAQVVDTLQWLKTNIEQRKNIFIGKPLKVVLDSLKQYKKGIKEYSGASDASVGLYINDTIWVDHIILYFEPYLGSEKVLNHIKYYLANSNQKDTTNSHIKRLSISFINPLPFLSAWWDSDRNGIGGETWNKQLEYFYRKGIVKEIKVDEY